MRFGAAFGVPKKSDVARLFKVFATAVPANFQGFYADDERSERRHGESDATELRYGESDKTERRYKTVGGRRRADQRIFSMPIFWTLRPSFS